MPAAHITIEALVVRLRPTYTCRRCGGMEKGTATRLDILDMNCNIADVGAVIERQMPPSNRLMPMGWSGFGLYEHQCPDCHD